RQHLQMAQSAAQSVGVDAASITGDTEALGSPAPGTIGTRDSDKTLRPAGEQPRSSLDQSELDNDADVDLDANLGDNSLDADADLDVDPNNEQGRIFQKGDGKILGLPT